MKLMDTKGIYTATLLALFLLLATTSSCRQEQDGLLNKEGASLTLQFQLTPATLSRSGHEGITHLYYEVKDGQITPCEVPQYCPASRAGDGNAADGGGMADLTVFIVDADDRIVERESFTYTTNVTTQSISFPHLQIGTYTVYAYANVQGNDWFSLPSETETSFSEYKDSKLKAVDDGVPTIQNDRMPLTGKQEMTIGDGNNTRTVSLLRPVGRLSVTATNEREDAVTAKVPEFGAFIPQTGWVFQHDNILTESNSYHPIASTESSYAIIPGSYHKIFETLLYESVIDNGFTISMTYEGVDYVFQENLSGSIQQVKEDPLLIKLYKEADNTSEDLFLCLEKTSEDNYQLGWVTAHELEDNCFWKFTSNGKQQRGLQNIHYNVYLNMSQDNGFSFSSADQTFKYGGAGDYTIIGEGAELTYSPENGFSVSSNGTKVQFFTYNESNKGSGSISGEPIMIQDPTNNSRYINLNTIHRNQHIQLNLIFK